jgi:ATP-dependent Clp protease ATP-binding subunit ClpC
MFDRIRLLEYHARAMNHPFTHTLSSAVDYAHAQARQLGQEYVGTEHLLLGMLDCSSGHAIVALKSQVSVPQLRSNVVQLFPKRPEESFVTGRLPLSPNAQRIINTAISESQAAGEAKVSTRSVLLAMIGATTSGAVESLRASGADLDELHRLLQPGPNGSEM